MPDCCGYTGRILKIDLCSQTTASYSWGEEDRRNLLGGKILAAQILRDHLTGKETAFSGDNWVVISTGPLTGTGAPGSARFDLAALSPGSNLPAFSNCGGDFGIWLKKAGYDALILTGQCRERCWLEITEDRVVFHEAKALWGTGTSQCQELLAGLLGTKKFGRLCIGPAGENLITFASVIGEGHFTGRAGIGAVLGWKNLKAITVTGSREIRLRDPEAAAVWNRKWYAQLGEAARVQNTGESFCPACPLHCSRHLHGAGETVLNELGMDAIAAKNAAIWAAEQGHSLQTLYEDIAFRRGVGEKLAEGVPYPKGKSGKRRGGNYGTIAKAFGLDPQTPETAAFCRALTEAVSAVGQCVFTVNGLCAPTKEEPLLPVLKMLALVTGMEIDQDGFLQAGRRFAELEQQIREEYKQNNRL